MRKVRVLPIALVAACLAALVVPVLASSASTARPLPARLARALAPAEADGTTTGAIVIDVETLEVLYARNADRGFVPASTEKLPVALTALEVLGPGFRAQTVVFGDGARVGPTWEGDLILKGYGDPDLRRLDLKRLARKLRATGLRRVTGSVVGDESHFDGVRTAPGWKPSFYKLWSPPISALVVNRARFAGTVSDEPARAAALIFTRLLERQGIDVAGEPRVGSPDVANATRLARDLSRPLAALVDRMNTESDNFIAEMLIKTLGAQAHQTGTTAAGARVVKETLRTLGIPVARVRIRDGSGLSRSDRLTPRALSAMLLAALGDAGIGEVFVGSLPVGGMTGTLEERLRKRPALGRIRAKTGTTSLSSALAGFVDDRYAFAVIMNRSPVNATVARAAQDRFVTVLARAA